MSPPLPQKSDLEMVVGESNVSQWADVDNDGSVQKKNARVTWAIQQAYNYVTGRIACQYDITTFVTFPSIIFNLIARRACIELYRSPRGLVDGDASVNQLNSMDTQIESQIDQILAGILKLVDAPVAPLTYPEVSNAGCLPWMSTHNQRQWSGDPCVIPFGNFYAN